MREKNITWKQAMAWRWDARTATFKWTNPEGRRVIRGDRLGGGSHWLHSTYAKKNRLRELDDLVVTLTIGNTRYTIERQPMPKCRNCGRYTWVRTIGMICEVDTGGCQVRRGWEGRRESNPRSSD